MKHRLRPATGLPRARAAGPSRSPDAGPRRLLGLLLAGVLGILAPASGRGTAAGPESMALLWLPDLEAVSGPVPVVIALQDLSGIDSRGWHYAERLNAAGIAVLHFEPLDHSAGGTGTTGMRDEDNQARERLAMLVNSVVQDPRFAGAPIGLLAFGGAGQVALRFAAGADQDDRIAGLVLLYPGCDAMLSAEPAAPSAQRAPVLLLHGDTDPANRPADCGALVDRLARSAPVRRSQLARAGYAFDRVPYGLEEAVMLPWPGRPGDLVRVGFSPEAAQRAAAQVEAFVTAILPGVAR